MPTPLSQAPAHPLRQALCHSLAALALALLLLPAPPSACAQENSSRAQENTARASESDDESAPPTAQELLALVRHNESNQDRALAGRLRVSSRASKLVIPFRLEMRGDTVTYRFSDPPEAFRLRLLEKSARLERIVGEGSAGTAGGTSGEGGAAGSTAVGKPGQNGKTSAPSERIEPVTAAGLARLVRGTDISYEDLALKFLYWSDAQVEPRREILMTRRCWIVRATPPEKGASQYDQVRLWVERTGGLLQIECSAGGRVVRRFKVVDVQSARDTGGYILKSMRIEWLADGKPDRYPTLLDVRQE